MITFTKEQLIASAHARIEFAEMMLAGELEPLKERTWSIELELARIALASLEAGPVLLSLLPPEIVRDDTDGYWLYKGERVSAANAAYYNQAIADFRAAMLQGKADQALVKKPSSDCPKCGGYGTYHCPQMLGTIECECTLSAAPQQGDEVVNCRW